MRNVDFSRARLRWCSFRGLDLDTVIFPQDDEHIVLRNFPQVLDILLERLGDRPGAGWKGLSTVLADQKRWLGPHQMVGMFNTTDLGEMVGEDNLREALQTIAAARRQAESALH
jgi:hypothetical protein